MNLKLLILILLFNSLLCFSQKENNIWYFGNKAGVNFNSGSPVSINDGKMTTIEGCASISNASGQLLFYTNGQKVWNRNHQIMPNGSNLNGDASSSQSAIFIPKPGSNTIYYLFTTVGSYPNGLTYSEINITLNGGLGDLTNNKNIPLYTPICEKICAIKNTSDNSYWVVTHAFGSNSFLTFSITASGVNHIPIISNVGSVISWTGSNFNGLQAIGYMKFSPDGSKIVSANSFKDTQLFDFNLTTGRLTNAITLNTIANWSSYGAEFSPSGKILYLTVDSNLGMATNNLLQYDLTATNIAATETIIFNNSNSKFGGLQLAPDCKIYGNYARNNSLYVISNPDALGLNCSFQPTNLQLRGLSNLGLPQFIQNSNCKSRAIVYDDICIGNNTIFNLSGSDDLTAAFWSFGDGNTSSNLQGENNYSAPGNYTITGEFTTPTLNFTVSKIINVPENPMAHALGEISICDPANTTYDLSQLNNRILGNQSPETYGISYFSSMNDAITHSNLLTPIQILNNVTTVIFAKVYRLSNFDCYGITSFTIRLSSYPVLNPITQYKVCDDGLSNDGFASFDLNTKTAEFLNGQSPSDFKVSYHLTLLEAENNLNPLLAPFTNTSNPQTIYARIATLPAEQCYKTASFSLMVQPSPEFNMKPFYVLCEGNGNYVEVSVPDTFNNYYWSTGSAASWTRIAISGRFWVKVGQTVNGLRCSRTKEFQVVIANKATIKKIELQDWTDNQNSILILIDSNSLGEYEYSIDGINYQESNFFDELTAKEYTVYVREKNGCGITTDEIFLLTYPKFFTPNDDGYNDEWSIRFSEIEPNLTIKIFDRYGKLLSTSLSWNGRFEGKPLPSDDYWFIVTRENGKEYRGHFTLKR